MIVFGSYIQHPASVHYINSSDLAHPRGINHNASHENSFSRSRMLKCYRKPFLVLLLKLKIALKQNRDSQCVFPIPKVWLHAYFELFAGENIQPIEWAFWIAIYILWNKYYWFYELKITCLPCINEWNVDKLLVLLALTGSEIGPFLNWMYDHYFTNFI